MTKPATRVLLTEDVASDAELELRELRRAGLRVAHRVVDTEEAFVHALREFSPDVILSDFSMPHFDGMQALALAREHSPHTPFIFVSGTIGEEYAIRALRSGATDYVLKTNLVRLPAAVERALEDARARQERAKVEAELYAARERLAGITRSLPDVFWSIELPSEAMLYVGPNSVEIFGRVPAEFLTDPDLWAECVHPDDRAETLGAWRAFVIGGAPYDVEYRIVRRDGNVRWVSDRGHVVYGIGGKPERADGVLRDISEQVEHRRHIARLSRIREFSSSINSALVRLRDRDALFQEVCRVAVEVGGFEGAHVGLLDAQTRNVNWAAYHGRGLVSMPMQVSADPEVEAGQGLVGQALRSGKPALWNDIAGDPAVRNRERFLEHGVNAVGSFPLIVEGQAVGVYSLHAAEAGFFDREEIALLEELASNVSFALELIEKQDKLAYLALYDVLTGLPNRRLFQERLTQAIQTARRTGAPLGLVLMDLERFKAINDTLGPEAGDRVLQAFSKRLQATVVDNDRLARLGSNVFALLFQDIAAAEDLGRRVEAATPRFFGEPFKAGDQEVRLAAKTGIAVYPDDGGDAEALFRNAEAALKRAKETGERIQFYAPEINARVSEQVQLEHRLREAVEQGELYFHYQPKVDLVSRRMVGLEALMRWKVDGAPVSPAKFVPVLEQTGLILEAGRQALAAATSEYRAWQAKGMQPPRIAVNVSALQLRRKSFVEDVRAALGDLGSDGGGVDLEITESLLMDDIDQSIAKLRALRDLGMQIALDDFGTGFSSLAYLSQLPLDTLKIDRAFVRGITEKSGDTSIVSTIISLAQSLRLKVVAEGVETEPQAQLLRLLRCDQAQGYLFSPPRSADEIGALLQG